MFDFNLSNYTCLMVYVHCSLHTGEQGPNQRDGSSHRSSVITKRVMVFRSNHI